MTPALHIHPTWLHPGSPPVSGTWRWFYLERWIEQQPPVVGYWQPGPIHLDPNAPECFASILETSAWIVAESLMRDGISRGRLDPDDMRWSRRLGLALLGDSPVTGIEQPVGHRPPADRDQHALEVIGRVVGLFPTSDQSVLRLALPATVPHTPQQPSPHQTSKTTTLIRLAKRHAAARFGVDLRQVTTVDFDPSAGARFPEEFKHVG